MPELLTTENAHTDAALFMTMREQRPMKVVARFCIDGEPVSKSRARFTKRGSKAHAYTPQRVKEAEERVGWAFKAAAPPGYRPGAELTYGVVALFFNGTRQRRDVDNMVKLVLDSLNGVAWEDDNQVVEISARKGNWDRAENARTEVLVYVVGKVYRLTNNCKHCDGAFETWPSLKGKTKFCSPECRNASRRKARQRSCERCGSPFMAHGASRETRFCSKECFSLAGRVDVECSVCGDIFSRPRSLVRKSNYCSDDCRRANDARVHRERRSRYLPGTCLVCGSGTTKKEYKRCNPCKRKPLPT